MLRTHPIVACLGAVALLLVALMPAAASADCQEGCRAQQSARLTQCQRENFSYVQDNMTRMCVIQANNDYDACMRSCPGYSMGPRSFPSQRIQPQPPYSPGSSSWRNR